MIMLGLKELVGIYEIMPAIKINSVEVNHGTFLYSLLLVMYPCLL